MILRWITLKNAEWVITQASTNESTTVKTISAWLLLLLVNSSVILFWTLLILAIVLFLIYLGTIGWVYFLPFTKVIHTFCVTSFQYVKQNWEVIMVTAGTIGIYIGTIQAYYNNRKK
jgi:hypothetical protein